MKYDAEKKPRILVADVSPDACREVGSLLQQQAVYEHKFAHSGTEAIAALADGPPFDLILTDLLLPDLNGLQLLEHVVEHHPLTPVVLMTALGSEEIAVEALNRGAASYIPKRSLRSSLADVLDNVLTASRRHKRHARLMECMTVNYVEFVLDNDREYIPALWSFLQERIGRLKLFPPHEDVRIGVALQEALMNAIVHGNLEIDSATREGDDPSFETMVDERTATAPYRDRRVTVACHLDNTQVRFVVQDEGPGFDPRSVPDPRLAENILKASGRGLLLMKHFMDEVTYNLQGNCVTLVKRKATDGSL